MAEVSAAEQLDVVQVNPAKGIQTDDVYSEPKSFTHNTQTFTQESMRDLPVANAYEMLDYATGAFIQTQGRKSPYFASIRAGSNLGIIIDGAYLPPPAASKVLMQLPVTAIDSMTIVRDASALNLGPLTSIIGPMTSSRTEGFIVIKTQSGFKKPNRELHAKVGSYRQFEVDTSLSGKFSDEVAGRVVFAHQQKQGPSDYYNDYRRDVGLWKLEGLGENYDWQVNFFHADGEKGLQQGLDTSGVSDAKWRYDPLKMRMINAQAGYYWNQHSTTAVRLSHTQSDALLQKYSHSNPDAYAEEKTEEEFINFDLSHALNQELAGGQNSLRFGYNSMWYHNPTGMLYYPGWERKEQIQALYLQNEFRQQRWSIDMGLRADKRTIDKGYEQIGSQRRLIEDVELDTLLTGALGASYQLTQQDLLTLRILYTEQQPVSVYTLNNDQLEQENRLRTELGWSRKWLVSPYYSLKTTLTGFHERLKNGAYVAGQVDDPQDTESKINVYDNASWTNRGFEIEVEGGWGQFSYGVAYSRVSPGDTPTGVVNVPESLVRARIGYQTEPWQFNLGARNMDEFISANKAGMGSAGGFTSYDASLGYRFKRSGLSHHLVFSAKNLTDQKYETVYGFPSEGLNLGVDYYVRF
ncbi:TonB-dependent receptor plug domain-containing protein [Thiomicrorhabdus sp. 6S2-11]|uniref:TonB-dependent receptor plug domain-containing protein n=1 Tax=Thiomicrorhabdus marina TaxID=2818442 RepID=A0ABS3Q4I0_9GAMM|nr:TonB-dependent receptor plug domain-containing protein [Thiomicrorhabdus marina]MBO1927245.1 TonB-dependent receptor plug domain-containing protein [Thiomicrorhabdus marina]